MADLIDKLPSPEKFSMIGIITKGLVVLCVYLLIIGSIGWSDQLKWMLLIGIGFWVLLR